MKLKVTGSSIRIIKDELIVTGSLNAYEIQFEFDKKWNQMTNKTAVFYQPSVNNGTPYYRIIDEETNTVILPWEVVVRDDYLYIGVFGFNETATVRIPTIYTYVYVKTGAYSVQQIPDPDPSLYEQIYNMALKSLRTSENAVKTANEAKEIAEGIKKRADDGEFDGYSPTFEVETETDEEYRLKITSAEGTFETPNLKGPKGDPGSGSGSTFEYSQSTPSGTWEITHNLNRYPSVTVVDSAGTQVVGDVTYIDRNNLKVVFSAEFSGTAYLN